MCVFVRRQRRVGIDLVHDYPEKELLKEVEVYQGVLALLYRTKAQMDEQMRSHSSMFTQAAVCLCSVLGESRL